MELPGYQKKKKTPLAYRCLSPISHNMAHGSDKCSTFFSNFVFLSRSMQAKFKTKSAAIMAIFFSLTTPVGAAIGIAISSSYNENSPPALVVEGTFNGLADGILIYMALVDLLAEDFMNPRVQTNLKIQLWVNVSLLLGAGCMSLLGRWA